MMEVFSTQSSTLDRLFGWWYALSAPPAVADTAPLQERIFMRRARLTSGILLIEIIYHLFSFVLARNFSGQADSIIAIISVSFAIAILLNRMGKTVASGILGFIVVEMSVCVTIIHTGFFSGGLAVKDLAAIALLLFPELIALSLFPTLVAFLLCALNCLFSIVAMLFFPKTPEMVHLFATSGWLTYFQPVGLQCVGIAVGFFWVSSADKEMKRADRAEEVSKLTQTLAFQQNTSLIEKKQLEENMQQIVAVHMQAASGDFSARVPFEPQSMLWTVSISLNNLLARLQVWRRDEHKKQQRTEEAIQGMLYEIRRARWQGRPLQVQKTGTPLDLLLDELSRNMASHPSSSHQSPPQSIRLPALPPEIKK